MENDSILSAEAMDITLSLESTRKISKERANLSNIPNPTQRINDLETNIF